MSDIAYQWQLCGVYQVWMEPSGNLEGSTSFAGISAVDDLHLPCASAVRFKVLVFAAYTMEPRHPSQYLHYEVSRQWSVGC